MNKIKFNYKIYNDINVKHLVNNSNDNNYNNNKILIKLRIKIYEANLKNIFLSKLYNNKKN